MTAIFNRWRRGGWLLFLSLIITAALTGAVQAAEPVGSVVLKAMLVNPDETKPQKVPVELPLPREVAKKDVMELSEGLKIFYDSEQAVFKAVGQITLEPGEEKTVQVRITDIWRVSEKEIQFQNGYLPSLLGLLENTKYAETGRQLGETIQARLDSIVKTQNQAVGPSRHIEIYRENLSVLNEVKKDIGFLEKLAGEKAPVFQDAMEIEDERVQRGVPVDSLATITLKMKVKNPSDTEKALLPVDYYLPPEVKEKDVINSAGLDVRYDLNRGAVFLHKDEVELEPGGSKVYEVVLRDIWRVEPEKMQQLEVKAAGFAQGLEGTKFEHSAVKLQKEVSELANQIVQNQSKTEGQPVEDRVTIFIENLSLLSQMKEKMTVMAKIEAINTTSPQIDPQSLGLETSTEQQEEATTQTEVVEKSTILFEGKSLDATTVWRMIFAIVGFLGFVSLLFYALWWVQVKMDRGMMGNEEV